MNGNQGHSSFSPQYDMFFKERIKLDSNIWAVKYLSWMALFPKNDWIHYLSVHWAFSQKLFICTHNSQNSTFSKCMCKPLRAS